MDKLPALEEQLKFKFKDITVLKNAFIHRSYLNEIKGKGLTSNERLEFLGDAILEFVVSEFLYKTYPGYPEGQLTNLRSILVRTDNLSKVARDLDLGKYLFLSKGEEGSGGRENDALLANTVEALIGAIYLDQGLKNVYIFINNFILESGKKIIKSKEVFDHKSRFQEVVQAKTRMSPVYEVISSEGPDHAKKFKVGVYVENELYGAGQGSSKQRAEQEAARLGLEKWQKMKYT